jgi:tetratricopeptide (TPR) repeat protein
MTRHWSKPGLVAALLMAVLGGCATQSFEHIARPTDAGQLGQARRAVLHEQVRPADDPLREATLAILTLDDGLPEHAEVPMQRVYETLRTRGLNANKQAAAVVLNEDLKIWKGEPYEQALLYLYVGMQQATVGAWGNTRAAAGSALELLDEFDRARGELREAEPTVGGYVVDRSDLALAHLLAGLANLQLGRGDEASDHFERVVEVRPGLGGLVDELAGGGYDTVLVVEMGAGPTIERGGADGATEVLVEHWPGDRRELEVFDGRGLVGRYPRVLGVNGFAAAYRWEGLAGLRRAKSNAGTVMAGTGAVLLSSDDEGARWAGLGLLLGGLFAKAGAHADDRSLQVLPERYFLVPLNRAEIVGPIELRLGPGPGESMVIPGFGSGGSEGFEFVLMRVPADGLGERWGSPTGEVLYANDAWAGRVPGDDLPWILGGRSVMVPSHEALARYQAGGYLLGMTTADLVELYRLEGIVLPGDERPGVPPDAHILEGGRSMATPRAGTLGFVRLFARLHPEYRPRSAEVARLAEKIWSGKEQR